MQENTATPNVSQDRRPIPGYEDLYEIDQQGNVFAIQEHKHLKAGRKKNVGIDPAGYVRIALCRDGKTKFRLIHRLVMISWQPIEGCDKLDVNHLDGNKQNNDINNLEWATHAENMRHAGEVLNAWQKRNQRGDKAGYHKLTEANVREIRRLWDNGRGVSRKDLAAIYGVTREAIGLVVRRKLWQHVE